VTPPGASSAPFAGDEETGRGISRYVRVRIEEVGPPDTPEVVGHAPVSAHLLAPDGSMRTGALLTLLDSVAGLCGGLAALPDGWVVSTNMIASRVGDARVGPLTIESRLLRKGRNAVVTSARIHDRGTGAQVLDGVLTSSVLVPEQGPPQWPRPFTLGPEPEPDVAAPGVEQWLGLRADGPDAVELDITAPIRNPWGILHGGVVSILADEAAARVTGGVTTDVALHFLAPNRTGPVRAHARVLGTRGDGAVVRVELRDTGASDRVTAVALATCRT
jgi:acyl-coenzyme A thioesterase PaaI-like protein